MTYDPRFMCPNCGRASEVYRYTNQVKYKVEIGNTHYYLGAGKYLCGICKNEWEINTNEVSVPHYVNDYIHFLTDELYRDGKVVKIEEELT